YALFTSEINKLREIKDKEKLFNLINELYLTKEKSFIFSITNETQIESLQYLQNFFYSALFLDKAEEIKDFNNLRLSRSTAWKIKDSLKASVINKGAEKVLHDLFNNLDSKYHYSGTLILEELKEQKDEQHESDSGFFPFKKNVIFEFQEKYVLEHIKSEKLFSK